MRTFLTGLALLAVLNLSILPVLAQTMKYTPGKNQETAGAMTGKVPVNKIGDMMAPDLEAILSQDSISIVDTKSGEKRLTGVPILSTFVKKGGKILWTGVCYWKDGPDKEAVAGKNVNKNDIITTKDGKKLIGKIKNLDGDSVEIKTETSIEKISTNEITSFKSPFATNFKCFVASTTPPSLTQVVEGTATLKFTKTNDLFQISKNPEVKYKEGMSKRTKIILAIVAVTLIAAAIAVPLAVAIPVSNSNRRRRNDKRTQDNLFLQNLLQTPNQNQNQNQNQN